MRVIPRKKFFYFGIFITYESVALSDITKSTTPKAIGKIPYETPVFAIVSFIAVNPGAAE